MSNVSIACSVGALRPKPDPEAVGSCIFILEDQCWSECSARLSGSLLTRSLSVTVVVSGF